MPYVFGLVVILCGYSCSVVHLFQWHWFISLSVVDLDHYVGVDRSLNAVYRNNTSQNTFYILERITLNISRISDMLNPRLSFNNNSINFHLLVNIWLFNDSHHIQESNTWHWQPFNPLCPSMNGIHVNFQATILINFYSSVSIAKSFCEWYKNNTCRNDEILLAVP